MLCNLGDTPAQQDAARSLIALDWLAADLSVSCDEMSAEVNHIKIVSTMHHGGVNSRRCQRQQWK